MSEPRSLKALIDLVATGKTLSVEQAIEAFDIMMSGEATSAQIGALLLGLRIRGETVSEITGGATIMRSKALQLHSPSGAIDVVGTGGDGSGSFNVSTATALVVAGCGVNVAKHGNRAMSSKCGSADVLKTLGVNIECSADLVQKSLEEANICFMLAPTHHAAMRHVGPTRVELGTRTIFNLLGPLSNPANVKRFLLGVFSIDWVEPLAHVLQQLGAEKAWVVHGSDGLDEITLTNKTYVAELNESKISTFEIAPEDAGLARVESSDLKGADPATNAEALSSLLDGKASAYRDIVILNSAAALIVADKTTNLSEGAVLAKNSIDQGSAKLALEKIVSITNE